MQLRPSLSGRFLADIATRGAQGRRHFDDVSSDITVHLRDAAETLWSTLLRELPRLTPWV